MTNLYKYFLTSEIICLDELPNITDIFLKTKNPQTKSILEKRKHEIDDFLDKKKKDKLELFDIKYYIFKDITELYNDLINIKINIKEFCIKLIFFLYSTKENISTIEKYLEINTIYPVLKNPFEYNSLSYLKSKLSNIIHENENKNISKNIDIITQGSFINFLMPSIGIVFSNLSSDTLPIPSSTPSSTNTFISLIEYILGIEHEIQGVQGKELSKRIPLLSIDINKTIIEILYKGFYNNTNNNNIIKKKIEEIIISPDDIFSIKTNNKKLNKKKIKTEYIIPYKYDSTKGKIILILKNEYGQKSVSEVLKLNYDIIKRVLKDLRDLSDIENLNKENYKNILACFLFFIIQLVYDINKLYLTKLNNVIMEISDISGLNFINMDIESTLEYISSLSKSLYKFKLILLNNFNTFLKPSKSFDNNYGMKKNENGYLQVEDKKIDFEPGKFCIFKSHYRHNGYEFKNSRFWRVSVNILVK